MAVAETRLDNADTRIAGVEADIRDLGRASDGSEAIKASMASMWNRAGPPRAEGSGPGRSG